MALTKEDLLAIGELMDGKLEKALNPIKGDIRTLKQDVGTLKQDVGALKQDVGALKQDMRTLNQTVAAIETDHGLKLGVLFDAHVDTVRNAATIKALDAKVEDHGHRIFALEQSVASRR